MSKFGVSEHTVDEVRPCHIELPRTLCRLHHLSSSTIAHQGMRIRFTKQLIKLRDDTVTEVVFSNELSNIERKFLHKLAEELGLKSKSTGMNDNRKITVTKQIVGTDNQADSEVHKFEMNSQTLKQLNLHYSGNIMNSAKPDNNVPYSGIHRNLKIIRVPPIRSLRHCCRTWIC